ncbi:hypothetical protein AK812_SmicGene10935 [Symbiodinium microadriaticum]|uniref:Uncharacterized protein n=1 Tax=Symbiodinium microadriaticum TaxID=2951 RepID=A0A1Q9EEG7_SYMMI|nr:hypothetical protein AK812_SmicGene10935 [Symbiodinium microadriaticum]
MGSSSGNLTSLAQRGSGTARALLERKLPDITVAREVDADVSASNLGFGNAKVVEESPAGWEVVDVEPVDWEVVDVVVVDVVVVDVVESAVVVVDVESEVPGELPVHLEVSS